MEDPDNVFVYINGYHFGTEHEYEVRVKFSDILQILRDIKYFSVPHEYRRDLTPEG